MLEDGTPTARRVIPRWRPLARTPEHETRPLTQVRRSGNLPTGYLDDAISRWSSVQSLENASDVIDAALTFENYAAAREAAQFVLSDSAHPVAGLRSAARQIIGLDHKTPVLAVSHDAEGSKEAIAKKVRQLKERLHDAPRDAITCLEIGRLQSLVGQIKSAGYYVERALLQEPNSRYIIRSAVRFFVHSRDPERALEFIRRSDAVRADPWVQAAEVATSDLVGQTPRWGVRQLRALTSQKHLGIEHSELAAGLATLELKNGSQRRIVAKLLSNSLQNPTENALAQAVWVNEKADIKANTESHIAHMSSAHEARVLAAYESGNGLQGANEAWLWFRDQPLSLAPALAGSYFSGTLLSQYARSLHFLEAASLSHPNHPQIINNKIVGYCYLGKLEAAKKQMELLETFSSDQHYVPFIQAARGLIAFRSKKIAEGRDHYIQAVETTTKAKDFRLTYYACMYWAEQEIFCGAMRPDEARNLIAELDSRFSKAPKSFRRFILQAWKARRTILETFILRELQENLFADVQKNAPSFDLARRALDQDKLVTP
ncbi:hypothetical protein U8607_24090 [Methylobacterium durans]|uniref:hypothetical protein n=1 Tax=Methylobacterium durans TaxID=2202825 RepID=UPI002AFFD420|nr:hypothetical protein [Methylobacterium durans]MEA1835171.1 hypothetical protein [Methylobacterium durans]